MCNRRRTNTVMQKYRQENWMGSKWEIIVVVIVVDIKILSSNLDGNIIYLEVFLVLLTSCRSMPEYDIKISHDHFP
jgi:hypothetical protein